MESYLLNVCGRDRGRLLQERTVSSNRPILSIRNSSTQAAAIQDIGFAKVTVDASGSLIAASDSKGKIFVFDLQNEKFHVVCRLDHVCSCIAFSSQKNLIAATSDCVLHFIDFVSCDMRKSIEAHKSCMNHISVNRDKSKAVTSASEDAAVWDLSTLTLLHRLANKKSIDILKVFFLPAKDHLVSAFRDNTVFLWNSNQECISHFSCSVVDTSNWLRSVDGSHDGTLLVCSGKVNWVSVWSVCPCQLLHNVSFNEYLTGVKQVLFMSSILLDKRNYNVAAVLSSSGDLFICDIYETKQVYSLPGSKKVDSFSEGGGILSVITPECSLDVYALALLFEKKQKETSGAASTPEMKTPKLPKKQNHKKSKRLHKCTEAVKSAKLKFLLRASGEYPGKYRVFIWSQILMLPRNDEFVLLHEKAHDISWNYFPIQNQTLERACSRILSMMYIWCPVLKEVDYIPQMIFPFVEVLHKNLQMCFEVLVTFICNWCQNWFLYLPFEPFNILCAVENLLLFHDRPLLHHFLMNEIGPEIYGFYLLKTAFTKVFSNGQWLKVWDHIFTNSPGFLLYLVVAFAISSREVLLQCDTEDEIRAVYSRGSSLASKVIQTALDMQPVTPSWCDPCNIFEKFHAIPQGGYPVFLKFTTAVSDLQTLDGQKAIDGELDNLLERGGFTASTQKMLFSLSELRRLQSLQRDLIMQSAEEKYTQHMASIEDKLKRIQKLMQSIIMNGVS